MSGDLISRSALLKEINSDENKRSDTLMREWYAEMVSRQPTTYDVDKVVEELSQKSGDSRKYWQEFDDEDAFGEMNAYQNAIEIVKGGGMNG